MLVQSGLVVGVIEMVGTCALCFFVFFANDVEVWPMVPQSCHNNPL